MESRWAYCTVTCGCRLSVRFHNRRGFFQFWFSVEHWNVKSIAVIKHFIKALVTSQLQYLFQMEKDTRTEKFTGHLYLAIVFAVILVYSLLLRKSLNYLLCCSARSSVTVTLTCSFLQVNSSASACTQIISSREIIICWKIFCCAFVKAFRFFKGGTFGRLM